MAFLTQRKLRGVKSLGRAVPRVALTGALMGAIKRSPAGQVPSSLQRQWQESQGQTNRLRRDMSLSVMEKRKKFGL